MVRGPTAGPQFKRAGGAPTATLSTRTWTVPVGTAPEVGMPEELEVGLPVATVTLRARVALLTAHNAVVVVTVVVKSTAPMGLLIPVGVALAQLVTSIF